MARVKIHVPCQLPLSECGCPPDADEDQEPGGDEPELGGEG